MDNIKSKHDTSKEFAAMTALCRDIFIKKDVGLRYVVESHASIKSYGSDLYQGQEDQIY